VSALVLSLLVALTSVLTAALPVVLDAVTPDRADIRYTTTECSVEGIAVLATNFGNRVAVVEGGDFEQYRGDRRMQHHVLAVEGAKPVLEPSAVEQFILRPPEDMLLPSRKDHNGACRYRIRLSIETFNTAQRSLLPSVNCPCPG
jgi:hypothetical protein